MNSELQILKKIWENKEESHIKVIYSQTGFSIDYTHYLCNCLLKKGKIKAIKGKRDWYQITPQGKKELEHRGLIKLPLLKKISARGGTEKVVYYFPKKLSHHSIKSTPNSGQKINIKIKKPKSNLRTSKAGLIESEEKKLNLGQSIMKAVSFLKKSTQKG